MEIVGSERDIGKRRKPFYKVLYFQVLVAIVLGVWVGFLFPETGASLKPLGDVFIKLIKW